jgi:hypothetical protein
MLKGMYSLFLFKIRRSLFDIDNYPSLPQDRLLALNYVGNRRIRMLGCGSRLKSDELTFRYSTHTNTGELNSPG